MGKIRSRSFLCVLVGSCVTLGACSSTPPADSSSEAELGGARDLKLSDVQRAIREQHANWTAGNTTYSALSRTDRRTMLGVPLSKLSEDRVKVVEDSDLLAPMAAAAPLPSTWDWRDHNGHSYVSPLIDQGRCGSCVAFAAVGTFETQLNITLSDRSSPFELSPQYLFACGGGGCGFGWDVDSAAQFLVDDGVPDSACMPYTSGAHGDDAECSAGCSDASKRSIKATSYGTPTSGSLSVTEVKKSLIHGAVAATMLVYDDFMYYSGGVYKHVTGGVAGGHAVSIIGWNDAEKAWIVRNSWGPGWGDKGFFKIAWDDVSGVGEETWRFHVAKPGPYVALNVRDATVLSGAQQSLKFDTKSLATGAQVSWTLAKGASQVAQGTSIDGTTATLDTTKVADGVYTLQAHATTGGTKVDSEPRLVYVLNGTESATIKFASLKDGQTLSGVAEFDINVTSAPVPLTHVDWKVTDANGKVVVDRTTPNTGKLMQIGWNTARWPNGKYTWTVTSGAGKQTIAGPTVTVNVKN
jgi:C1A family cysteine protease